MAILKTRAVVLDTKKLASEFLSLASSIRDQAAELARQSLQAQVNAIQAASAKRGEFARSLNMKTTSGTVDDPLNDAKVIVSNRKNSRGSGRVIVYVDSTIFNILNKGRKAGRIRQGIVIFPAYDGRVIPDVVSGDPDVIKGQIVSSNTIMSEKRVVLREGDPIGGVIGRNFYQATANWVAEQLVSQDIVSKSRRSKIHLKADDVRVYATDRARFNKT